MVKTTGKKVLLLMAMTALLVLAVGVGVASAASLIPIMTSNTTPSGVASTDTSVSNREPFRAFDGSINAVTNCWASPSSSMPHWLSYEFPENTIVNKYTIIPYDYLGSPVDLPGDWTFEGWNGSNWIVLDTKTDFSDWQIDIKKEFKFTNDVAYKKYRIYVTGLCNSTYNNNVVIHEMEMLYETPDITIITEATPGDQQVTLKWTAVTGATSYKIKRSETAGGPYTEIAFDITGTAYTDTGLTNGTTYYYVVTAVTTGGESENSNEASATPVPDPGPDPANGTLIITVANNADREYNLTMEEIQNFMAWYANRSTGGNIYIINMGASGAYSNIKDYLVFDKIVAWKVMEY